MPIQAGIEASRQGSVPDQPSREARQTVRGYADQASTQGLSSLLECSGPEIQGLADRHKSQEPTRMSTSRPGIPDFAVVIDDTRYLGIVGVMLARNCQTVKEIHIALFQHEHYGIFLINSK